MVHLEKAEPKCRIWRVTPPFAFRFLLCRSRLEEHRRRHGNAIIKPLENNHHETLLVKVANSNLNDTCTGNSMTVKEIQYSKRS